jgi:hypothetical protein
MFNPQLNILSSRAGGHMLPMSDQAILQQNKLRRLREEMMEVNMSRKHIEIYSSKHKLFHR